jgi:hypothetical protein
MENFSPEMFIKQHNLSDDILFKDFLEQIFQKMVFILI